MQYLYGIYDFFEKKFDKPVSEVFNTNPSLRPRGHDENFLTKNDRSDMIYILCSTERCSLKI